MTGYITHSELLKNRVEDLQAVYFIGIGGIGMSALARYFNSKGIRVSGYDKTRTPLTAKLESEGISVHYVDDTSLIDKEASLVVYTPAIPGNHTELAYFLENQYAVVKRSDVLSLVTRNSFSICVAGTHGKTTVSTLIAHILRDSGYGCSAFLGGISTNYDTNFWSQESNVTVTEADEYDRSFLKLSPDVAVITAMDPDHLEIYGTESAMQDAFVEFSGKIKQGGLLVYHEGLPREKELSADRKIRYSLAGNHSEAYVSNVRVEGGIYVFDAVLPGKSIDGIRLQMGGRHNVENALASVIVADYLKIESTKIKNAISAFRGVKRRFEYVVNNPGFVMIDDYAHHPQEVRALLSGVKELFPDKKVTVVFQPHLYTRTRDLADGFADALSLASEVILLPVYPARELPIPGVDSKMIADRIRDVKVKLLDRQDLFDYFTEASTDVLVMAGAGDIDNIVQPLRELLLRNKNS